MGTKKTTSTTFDAPNSHEELCARVRFSLDEHRRLSAEEQSNLDAELQKHCTQLRRNSIRATRTTLPRIQRMGEETCKLLLLESAPEIYVVSDPIPNAGVMARKDHPGVIGLNSGLIQILDDNELRAVLAHEIGHSGLRHGSSSSEGYFAGLYDTQRTCAGEVSADRVAMVATGSPTHLTTALIKMKCGLGSSELADDIEAALEHFAHPDNTDEDLDGPDSHPELPFRHWAMTRFAATDIFHSLMGRPGGEPFEQVEQEIEDRFHALDEGIAFRKTSDLVHEAVAWLGTLLVAHDEEVDERESQVLSELVGRLWAEDACNYARRNGMPAVERRAREVLDHLKHAGMRTRKRVTDIVREIGERSGNKAKVNETLALVASTFGIR